MLNKIYSSVLFFFLLPFLNILLGSIFASSYSSINYLPFLIFYIFVLINQMIENILLRIPKNNFSFSKKFFLFLEIFNGLIILFFGWQHSWLMAVLLFLYSIIIQSQFLFNYYQLDQIASIFVTLFKVILLNTLSFYIHTNFIHPKFILYYLGLFIPFYLFESTKLEKTPTKKVFYSLVILSYVFSILILWKHLALKSLVLLITLPTVIIFKSDINQKTTATFLTIFSMVYMILNIFSFVL